MHTVKTHQPHTPGSGGSPGSHAAEAEISSTYLMGFVVLAILCSQSDLGVLCAYCCLARGWF